MKKCVLAIFFLAIISNNFCLAEIEEMKHTHYGDAVKYPIKKGGWYSCDSCAVCNTTHGIKGIAGTHPSALPNTGVKSDSSNEKGIIKLYAKKDNIKNY